ADHQPRRRRGEPFPGRRGRVRRRKHRVDGEQLVQLGLRYRPRHAFGTDRCGGGQPPPRPAPPPRAGARPPQPGGERAHPPSPTLVDTASATVRGAITIGEHPSALLINSDRGELYAADTDSDQITVLDLSTETVARTIDLAPYPGAPVGSNPNALALSPAGDV